MPFSLRKAVLVKNPPPLENRSPGSVVVDYGEKEDNLIELQPHLFHVLTLCERLQRYWGD